MKKRMALAGILFAFAAPVFAAAVLAYQYTVTTPAQVVDTSKRFFPMSVTIAPQSGVTGSVEYSTTPDAAASPATAIWQYLTAASSVTTTSTTTVNAPVTAIRFTRISGASAVIGEIDSPQ